MKTSSPPWKPTETAAWNAGHVLPKLLRDYFKTGRQLTNRSSARTLHRFRLKTKQLRYTLEAFTPLYGPGYKSRLDSLRPIQTALGDANDCEVMLREMGRRLPHKVRAYVTRRASEKRKDFFTYWRDKFDTSGEEKKWEQYLKRFPQQPKAS